MCIKMWNNVLKVCASGLERLNWLLLFYYIRIFTKWAILFYLIFESKKKPLTGIELCISEVISNRSTNYATTSLTSAFSSFDRVVAFDTRGLRFQSSHRLKCCNEHIFAVNY